MSKTLVATADPDNLHATLASKMRALVSAPLHEARANAQRFPMTIALFRLMGRR